MSAQPALEFHGIRKEFAGQVAVNDVSFSVLPGEVHALVGENGAGKSTLIKVLAGQYLPEAGEVKVDGRPVVLRHPSQAIDHQLGFIHQQPSLVESMTVAENVLMGHQLLPRRIVLIDWRAEYARVAAVLHRVGLECKPGTPLARLSVHERQLVAIARVLLTPVKVLVLDEVTASLAQREVERLFRIIASLREQGVAMLYVSHRMAEVFEIADRVTVMREGRYIGTYDVRALDAGSLASLIVGRAPESLFGADTCTTADDLDRPIALSVRHLSDSRLDDVTFDVSQGEIIGVAGLAGSGRTRLLRTIFGDNRAASGDVVLGRQPLKKLTPSAAVWAGIGFVTEERARDGYVSRLSVRENITLPWVGRSRRMGLLSLRAERRAALAACRSYSIRARSIDVPISQLSGGNQQKALLARWMTQPLRLLLLDEPTHGVDIGAKAEIYQAIRAKAESGVPIIVVSSELEELESLCDRVLLLQEGTLIGELSGPAITKERILTELLTPKLRTG